eukprot:5320347-Prymnesium_polylepis.1
MRQGIGCLSLNLPRPPVPPARIPPWTSVVTLAVTVTETSASSRAPPAAERRDAYIVRYCAGTAAEKEASTLHAGSWTMARASPLSHTAAQHWRARASAPR